MKWLKKGLIYAPDGRHGWAQHYAFPPTPYFVSDRVLRLYLAFCDANTVGRLGYVEVDPEDPAVVLNVSPKPLLDIGAPGTFDENGLLPTSLVALPDGSLYLYYVGYQLGRKVRYYQFQGLAVSRDGGSSFKRVQQVPVLDRSDRELLHRTSAFVLRDRGVFRIWYVAGGRWLDVQGKSLPVYNMRYLESHDGINWPKEGRVCLDFQNDDEHAFGRPWVVKDENKYRMFYSVRTRSKGYRLGYAESADGIQWRRKDEEVGIDVSPSGWDSQMIAYSSIVRYRDRVYLFYNGNNCGQSGFGYAVLENW